MNQLNQQSLSDFINDKLKDTDCFLVSATIGKNNSIVVEIDSDSAVDIDFVARLNRDIEEHFAPEIDDYDFEVGSVGLTSPLVLPRQFVKNIGNDVEVLATDGKKYHGVLVSADDQGFAIEVEEKVKEEGQKRPVVKNVEKKFSYAEAKKVNYDIKF